MLFSPRWQRRLYNLLFLLLFGLIVGLLAWLSNRYVWQVDWTGNGRNTLSAASRELLNRLPGPVQITAFVRPDAGLHNIIQFLVARYQRCKSDIALTFVNPDTALERVRALGISQDGELYLEYQGRRERLLQLSEQGLSNALQRLSREGERTVLFLTGHGERQPFGRANYDLGNFGKAVEPTGIHLQELNLAKQPGIAGETAALVIAGPQISLLPGEVQRILDYVRHGGNLLWLLEPGENVGLQSLADTLGVHPLPGVIVDPDSHWFGIDNPAFIMVADYGPHPVTAALHTVTLFPLATALEVQPVDGWQVAELLLTQSRSWTETGPLSGPLRFDADSQERLGPLLLGVALSRPKPTSNQQPAAPAAPEQRVVVIGDGDFLANAYLGNGGNLELGLNLLNWLSRDDRLIAIPPQTTPDRTLTLSRTALAVMGIAFLLVLPLLLLGCGWLIWWRRRRR
jgi:ABC-type uncharacterized transport system involved in gliding motility auxiliary subunit